MKPRIHNKTEFLISLDMLLVLVILSGLSFYYYGIRALITILISVIFCILTDIACIKARKDILHGHDLSSVVTGIILALLMPASVPYYIVIIAAIFSIIISKQIFGGHGYELFNCAAVGFIFVSLCFPLHVLQYPEPFDILDLNYICNNAVFEPDLSTGVITVTRISPINILSGNYSGAMGSTHILVLIVGALFLMMRRSVSAIVFFTEMIFITLFSLCFNGFNLSVLINTLGSDILLFGIIFLSCDYSTVPKTKSSRFIYGLIVSIFTIVIQYAGECDNAIIYAVIIAAPIGIDLDKKALSFAGMLNNSNSDFIVSMRRHFNKHLQNVNETITLIDGDNKDNGSGKSKKS